MPIKIVSVLHTGVRIGPEQADTDKAVEFYGGLLGLQNDAKRPHIPGIPGVWMNIHAGDRTQQIHIFGAEGMSPVARSAQQDPTRFHVAFAVENLNEARAELKRRGVNFWVYENLVGSGSDQVFFEDPFGNMIELQEQLGAQA